MKWAIREAIDVYFKAKSVFKLGARTIRAGEPVLIFDTVKTSTFEVAAEIAYVTGGRGNSRILSFEGDKVLTFQFEEALLSNEGLAILSGADLIPARNDKLPGSSPDAQSVVAHFNEKYAVTRNNLSDPDPRNQFATDPSIPGIPRGGVRNIWLTRKPFVGQNASIYVMLLDTAGEMSGAPLEINLFNDQPSMDDALHPATVAGITALSAATRHSYLAKFRPGDYFIAFDRTGAPMPKTPVDNHPGIAVFPEPTNSPVMEPGNPLTSYGAPTYSGNNGIFDDQVLHYVDAQSAGLTWVSSWGPSPVAGPGEANAGQLDPTNTYVRQVVAEPLPGTSGTWNVGGYAYLLAPSGGVAQPKAFKEGTALVYQLNVPSVLFQDIVLLDYYVEYKHNATQISILPDKFGPYLYVEGSSLVRRASDGMDLPAEFVIPKFKVTTALTFTLASTGDPSTFEFQGDAYPDFSKFDLTRRVLADIQILDADDNYDLASGWGGAPSDPTDYRRFRYDTTEGEYVWKDPSMQPHQNLNYADTGTYQPDDGGPATITPGLGIINRDGLVSPVNNTTPPPAGGGGGGSDG